MLIRISVRRLTNNVWGTWWGMNYFYFYNYYHYSILCYAMSSTRQIQLWSTQSSRSYSRWTVRTTRIKSPHPSLIATLSQHHHECMYACTASHSLTHSRPHHHIVIIYHHYGHYVQPSIIRAVLIHPSIYSSTYLTILPMMMIGESSCRRLALLRKRTAACAHHRCQQ